MFFIAQKFLTYHRKKQKKNLFLSEISASGIFFPHCSRLKVKNEKVVNNVFRCNFKVAKNGKQKIFLLKIRPC